MSAVDASQPTLPVEILTQITQDYFAFRNAEVVALRDSGRGVRNGVWQRSTYKSKAVNTMKLCLSTHQSFVQSALSGRFYPC